MRFLSVVVGYRRTDHTRNQAVRQGLNIFIILDKIIEYQRDWFHHLERRDESRFSKFLNFKNCLYIYILITM
jgi:hypothetical protein